MNQLIYKPGTQVMCLKPVRVSGDHVHPAGTVGVVVASPLDREHSYRVKFADGTECSVRVRHVRGLKHELSAISSEPWLPTVETIEPWVLLESMVGSRAYGLQTEGSDTDLKGIYIAPGEVQWSLHGCPDQIEDEKGDRVYWEVEKFVRLALKSNPTSFECLYSPHQTVGHELGESLLEMRDSFLSKRVYQTFNGYAMSQFKKMEQDLRNRGKIKWKHAMHLIRVLLVGHRILERGEVMIDASEFRDVLLEIKMEQWSWERVNTWRLELHAKMEEAYAETKLPEGPDFEAANQWLLEARYAGLLLPRVVE